jgi:hypothetical protein
VRGGVTRPGRTFLASRSWPTRSARASRCLTPLKRWTVTLDETLDLLSNKCFQAFPHLAWRWWRGCGLLLHGGVSFLLSRVSARWVWSPMRVHRLPPISTLFGYTSDLTRPYYWRYVKGILTSVIHIQPAIDFVLGSTTPSRHMRFRQPLHSRQTIHTLRSDIRSIYRAS